MPAPGTTAVKAPAPPTAFAAGTAIVVGAAFATVEVLAAEVTSCAAGTPGAGGVAPAAAAVVSESGGAAEGAVTPSAVWRSAAWVSCCAEGVVAVAVPLPAARGADAPPAALPPLPEDEDEANAGSPDEPPSEPPSPSKCSSAAPGTMASRFNSPSALSQADGSGADFAAGDAPEVEGVVAPSRPCFSVAAGAFSCCSAGWDWGVAAEEAEPGSEFAICLSSAGADESSRAGCSTP
mmetsp:Transcript_14384/g.35891  ORF Transcript_14384/g.35891 Transcript_14384/m.35891 type:complete len:236 (-) Transcript_14384:1987-2694(-)